jgi:hypothetical protein
MEQSGYCIKCKKKMEIKDAQEVIMGNNMKGLRGFCSNCNNPIFTIAGKVSQPDKNGNAVEETKAVEGKGICKRKTICVKAGELAGGVARSVYPVRKGISKFGNSVFNAAQDAIKKSEKIVKDTFIICDRCKPKKGSANNEETLRKVFAQLGAKIFELRQKETQDVLSQPDVKKLFDEAVKIDETIQKARKEMEARRLAKEKENSFNRAVSNLKDNNSKVRLAAIRVLEIIGKKEAIVYLSNVLEDSDEAVRVKASAVIAKLTKVAAPVAKKARPKRESQPATEPEVKPETGAGPQLEPGTA